MDLVEPRLFLYQSRQNKSVYANFTFQDVITYFAHVHARLLANIYYIQMCII